MTVPDVLSLDLDVQEVFDNFLAQVHKFECRSLAVEFSPSKVLAGVNLTAQAVDNLLIHRDQQGTGLPCLWINLWGWTQEHQAIIARVAKHYDMSPRLAHAMCPRAHSSSAASSARVVSSLAPGTGSSALRSMADVFSTVWHFGTVDVGRRYICMGWNALFFLEHSEQSALRSKPNAVRIWSTILLCNDGTVVSVFEDPPSADATLLCRTRQNQISVCRNLSRLKKNSESALMQTSIRPVVSAQVNPHNISADMAGLLFYYLFDDWMNLFTQVSGSEHSYRHRLELLRSDMFERPSREQIDLLHQLGKQLGALRSICKSYQSLIEQLLRNQVIGLKTARLQVVESVDGLPSAALDNPPDSVSLPLVTVARFERLLNRIDLCAMTELDECIAEKDGLVQMVGTPVIGELHVHC